MFCTAKSFWFSFVFLTICFSPISCKKNQSTSPEPDREILARIQQLALPDGLPSPVQGVAPSLRIIVTLDSIDVDNMAEAQTQGNSLRSSMQQGLVTLQNGLVSPEQKRGGSSGFVINPLSAYLARIGVRDGHVPNKSATIYFDKHIPGRTVYDVLYTLGMNGYQQIYFAVKQHTQIMAVSFHIPSASSRADQETNNVTLQAEEAARRVLELLDQDGGFPGFTLATSDVSTSPTTPNSGEITQLSLEANPPTSLAVHIRSEGFVVAVPRGSLDQTCLQVGTSVTIPLVNHQYDHSKLSQCLVAIKTAAWSTRIRTQNQLPISFDSLATAETIIRTLQATQETAPGLHNLFSEPQLNWRQN